MGKNKAYLVDGSGYIFRAYYAVSPLSTKEGFPTNALFGFTRMLIKLLNESDSQHVVIVFDAGRETFRNKLYDKYKAQGLEIIGVALDKEGASVVKPFVENNKINYMCLIGNEKVVQDYGGIRGIPTTFVIDRNGNIYKKYIGYQEKEVFEKDIKDLL